MKKFLGHDFLLNSDIAIKLYQHAEKMPIIDYHNHLSPKDIAENRKFNNLTEAWLEGDHYKWRAMRSNGVAERYCTGDATAEDKFLKWAETVPYTMRNPLYHWAHLELKNYFGIHEILDEKSGKKIYERGSAMLQSDQFRVQSILKQQGVEVLCTTDDPTDTLEYHLSFAKQNAGFRMFPTFRPDKSFSIQNVPAYNEYLGRLGQVAGVTITRFEDLLSALQKRVDYFHQVGAGYQTTVWSHCTFIPIVKRMRPFCF